MRRANPVNFFKAQPRFLTAALAGVVVWFMVPQSWAPSTRLLVAWDCATGLYLMMALVMMLRSNTTKIRFRAAREDEGQLVVLGLTSITALISLGGIVAEMEGLGIKGACERDNVIAADLQPPRPKQLSDP